LQILSTISKKSHKNKIKQKNNPQKDNNNEIKIIESKRHLLSFLF